jgi:hypothetical protein
MVRMLNILSMYLTLRGFKHQVTIQINKNFMITCVLIAVGWHSLTRGSQKSN